MRIYIQSKSGNFNVKSTYVGKVSNDDLKNALKNALTYFRGQGGYHAWLRDGTLIFVPFEEIEYIMKADEGEKP